MLSFSVKNLNPLFFRNPWSFTQKTPSFLEIHGPWKELKRLPFSMDLRACTLMRYPGTQQWPGAIVTIDRQVSHKTAWLVGHLWDSFKIAWGCQFCASWTGVFCEDPHKSAGYSYIDECASTWWPTRGCYCAGYSCRICGEAAWFFLDWFLCLAA